VTIFFTLWGQENKIEPKKSAVVNYLLVRAYKKVMCLHNLAKISIELDIKSSGGDLKKSRVK